MKLLCLTCFARPQRSGFTLLETMIAVTLGMIAFAALASLSLFTARSFVAAGNYADLDRASFVALDTMSRDIRQSRELVWFTPYKLTLRDNDGTPLVYEYKPETSQFTRLKNGKITVLLEQCDYLKFAIYQRTPNTGWTWYPVTSPAEAKLVDVSWKCSRKILGAKVNTESVQTAKVVIRN